MNATKGGFFVALYLLSIKPISRTQNRSSVEAAAYRSGEKLYNEREDITYDFTRKKGVVHTEILLPEKCAARILKSSSPLECCGTCRKATRFKDS